MKILWDSKRNWLIIFLIMVIGLMITFSIKNSESHKSSLHSVHKDFSEIKKDSQLTVISGFNSTSYFLYKGRPMGFEYELLERLAQDLDLNLNIVLSNDLRDQAFMLNRGDGDLIAYNLKVSKNRRDVMQFTDPFHYVEQVLVQRKPENYWKLNIDDYTRSVVTSIAQLANKKIHIRNSSIYYSRLLNLEEETGEEFNIELVNEELTDEDLIRMVSEGEIEFTIADKNVALLNQTYLKNIDVDLAVSFPQSVAWGVRRNAPVLQDTINQWINKAQKSGLIRTIYQKYFENERAYIKRMNSDYLSITGGGISPYDELFKKYANEINWDWKLLAAQCYHESKFDPDAKSWAGAKGLMQLINATAAGYIDTAQITDPEKNIYAASKYISHLNKFWNDKISDIEERRKFILASYNVGEGHILDAIRLSEKFGDKTDVWTDNVEKYIRLKSNPKYYKDEVVRNGYCRGEQTYKYVRSILNTYDQYKMLVN